MREKITFNKYRAFYFIQLLAFSILLISGCKKEKLDAAYRQDQDQDVKGLSFYRFINLGGYTDIRANGDSLTNFWAPLDLNFYPSLYYKFPGTAHFPKNGKFEKTWKVTNDAFQPNGRADFIIEGFNTSGQLSRYMGLTIRNEAKLLDYYLLDPNFFSQPYIAVDRSETPPSNPANFKIRIINLTKPVPYFRNARGEVENLDGPVSLAYADGTLINDKTSHLDPGKMTSDYIELPYGTYQFKILTENGRQIPATDGQDYRQTVIDPPTSTMAMSQSVTSDMAFIPVQTYQPGGIYTIVVQPFIFRVIISVFGDTLPAYQNAFRIISDNEPPLNTSFTQFQAFNALPGQAVTFKLNGKNFADNLPYEQAFPTSIEQAGTYKIEAVNADGEVLASQDYPLNARQNYTAWIYPDPQGHPQLAMEANDISGTIFKGQSQEDGTYDYTQVVMPFGRRFLNLSPDVPYLTFTAANGGRIGVDNLKPGEVPSASPYVWSTVGPDAYQIMAYRSQPDVVPGIWAADIPVLSSQDLIARKALYTNAGRVLPPQEAGIFTVALIGRTGSNVPEAQKAKMVVLKHNK